MKVERESTLSTSTAQLRERYGPTPGILLEVDAQHIAEQVTLFDYDLLCRIHPIEFIHYFFPDAHPAVADKWPNLQVSNERK